MMFNLLFFALLILPILDSFALAVNLKPTAINFSLVDKWKRIANFTEKLAWPHLQVFNEWVTRKNITTGDQCKKELTNLTSNLIKIFDSNAKIAPGFVTGALMDFGNFDQCMAAGGHYCLASIYWPTLPRDSHGNLPDHLPLEGTSMEGTWLESLALQHKILHSVTFRVAVCLPETCSPDDLNLDRLLHNKRLPLKFNLTDCQVKGHHRLTGHQDQGHEEIPVIKIISQAVLASLLFVSLVASCVTFDPKRMLSAFSISENYRKLFFEPRDQETKRIAFLNGLRFVLLFSNIAVHLCVVPLYIPTIIEIITFKPAETFVMRRLNQTFWANVCGPFIIGGLVTYFLWQPEFLKKKGNISFARYSLLRWVRALPMLFCHLLVVFAMPSELGTGPAYKNLYNNLTNNCFNSWFSEVHGISTMDRPFEKCMLMGWHMQVDYKLYLLAFPISVILAKEPKRGVMILLAAILAGPVLQTGAIWWRQSSGVMKATGAIDSVQSFVSLSVTHMEHYNHISSYFSGMLLAHIIRQKIELNKRHLLFGWITFGGIFLIALEMPLHIIVEDSVPLTQIVTMSVLKFSVMAFYCWLAYYFWLTRSVIGDFLSLKVWTPFSKIIYPIFISHYLFIIYQHALLRRPLEFRFLPILERTVFNMAASIFLGLLAHLFIEAPCLNILKLALFENEKIEKENNN